MEPIAATNIDSDKGTSVIKGINRNKLHATLCILASSSASISVFVWLLW